MAEAAASAGIKNSAFIEHEIDGSALHEMAQAYDVTRAVPALVEAASDKAGPKLRFLRLMRQWARKADYPVPAAPPPPLPPLPELPVRRSL